MASGSRLLNHYCHSGTGAHQISALHTWFVYLFYSQFHHLCSNTGFSKYFYCFLVFPLSFSKFSPLLPQLQGLAGRVDPNHHLTPDPTKGKCLAEAAERQAGVNCTGSTSSRKGSAHRACVKWQPVISRLLPSQPSKTTVDTGINKGGAHYCLQGPCISSEGSQGQSQGKSRFKGSFQIQLVQLERERKYTNRAGSYHTTQNSLYKIIIQFFIVQIILYKCTTQPCQDTHIITSFLVHNFKQNTLPEEVPLISRNYYCL